MRILHVFAGPYPTHQGTQALVGQTCRALAGNGHDVHLLCYARAAFGRDEPFVIHRIPDIPEFDNDRSGPNIKKLLLDISLSSKCAALSRTLNPDIIHAHHYEALVAARIAIVGKRKPLIFQAHALMGPELGTYLPVLLEPLGAAMGCFVDRAAPQLADHIIAISENIQQEMSKTLGMTKKTTLARPYAESSPEVEISRNSFGNSRIKAVYTGNLDRYQGVQMLLEAMAICKVRLGDRLLLEIHTACETDILKKNLESEGLNRFVEVHHLHDIWSPFDKADFAVIPRSNSGGVPIKLINALSAAKPVIADRRICEGLKHGEEAWLVDASDPKDIARGCIKLCNDERLRKKLATGATSAVTRLFSRSVYIDTLNKVYSSVVQISS